MDILDAIVNAQSGAAVQQLGAQLGLGREQTTNALSALLPALAAGVQRNLGQTDGLSSLAAALASGNHARFLDNPAILGQQAAVSEGNGILGHILGSKEVSREVASRAAAETGVGTDVLKRMLPLAAALMMGAFSKQAGRSHGLPAGAGSAGIAAMLTPLLDRNRDGSIVDDVTSMIGRFMKS
ncbi:MAG: DUF937 domain-containing protein [Acidobacteria bacterium]|nr:DUF937 domain-containing protein [Acidobacteriota bacterium]